MSGMNFKKTLLALLLTLALLFTLSIPAFAEETTAESQEETTTAVADDETTADPADGETTAAVSDEETTAAEVDGETTAEADADTTAVETTTAATTGAATTAPVTGFAAWTVGEWISLGIGVAILVTIAVFAIMFISVKDDGTAGKDGSKVPFSIRGKRFFRSTKSEAKKVAWTPWKTVRKNTLVVVIVMIVFALLIGLLDFVFSEGINVLAQLFS